MSFQSQSTYHIRIIIFAQLHLIYPIQITYHNIVSKQTTIFKKDTMDTIITLQFSFNSIVERCIAIVVTIACNNVILFENLMHNAYVLWNQEELRIAFDTSLYIRFENI